MNNRDLIIVSLSLALIITGCVAGEDEPFSPAVEPTEWSEAEEINHWIYEQMDHHYFWRGDLPDSASCDFTLAPKEFYNSLLSSKDRFSYFDYKSSRAEMPVDLGFAYQEYVDDSGAHYAQVLYVTSKNAADAGLRRGDWVKIAQQIGPFVHLDLMDFRDGNYSPVKSMTYEVDSRAKVNETVQKDSIYDIDGKKIGYLCYLQYDEVSDLTPSLQKFKLAGIDELVLDLRYNPGGLSRTSLRLCNMIVPESAYGKMYDQLSYNDIVAQENLERYGDERTYSFFGVPNDYSGPTLGPAPKDCYLKLNRVYVLVSKHTASASEATINNLKPYMDVVVIGENTVGKGVGMQPMSTRKFRYELVAITFRFYNSKGETIPDDGLVPDVYVPDGYSIPKRDLGDLSEPLLSEAIKLITGREVEPEPETEPESMGGQSRVQSLLVPIGQPSFVTAFNIKQFD